MEECTRVFKILTGNPSGIESFGRVGHIWEDNIKINLKEICVRDTSSSAQDF